MAGDNPAATELRVYLASDQMKLGILLLQMGKPEAAEAECRTSVAILGKLAEDNPAVTLYPECLAPALNHLGDVARSLGRAAEAKRSYDRTIALMVPRFEAKPTSFSYRHVIVSALRRRGQTLRDLGDPAARPPISAGRSDCARGCCRVLKRACSRGPPVTRHLQAWPVWPDRASRRSKEKKRPPGHWNGWAGRSLQATGTRTNSVSSRPSTRFATAPTSRS